MPNFENNFSLNAVWFLNSHVKKWQIFIKINLAKQTVYFMVKFAKFGPALSTADSR